MKDKVVAVTGGAGFIGCHIVDACLEAGAKEVRIVDNFAAGRKEERINPSATLCEIDIRDFEALKKAFEGVNYVFHTAALPRVQYSIDEPVETASVNIQGTQNVLMAAHEVGAERVVYSASSSAYGPQEIMPLVETMPPNPISPYGMQKYFGEVMCKVWSEVYGLPTVSLRYFNIYGPRHDPEGAYALVIGKFIKQRKEGGPMTITGDGTQTRDFTHVDDAVRANLLAATSEKVGKGEVLNIGRGNNESINRIAELIGGPTEYIEARLEPHDTLADNKLAQKLLDWQPEIATEEGIESLCKECGLR